MKQLSALFTPRRLVFLLVGLILLSGCSSERGDQVGVSFDTLQTEFWVESLGTLQGALEERGFTPVTAVADGDENRQLEQMRSFIVRGVKGIIVAPKNDQAIVPALRLATEAGIPVVVYNRPPAVTEGLLCVTVVADNFAIAKATVERMVALAKEEGRRRKGLILIGDLGDQNAVERMKGFDAAIEESDGLVEVVARVPTEWDQEKARIGILNALQVNPDIDFIFTSSDFLLPSVVAALKSRGKYHEIGHPEHVLLGGFDGDPIAYGLIKDGYMDATGVQDLFFEAEVAVQAIEDLNAGVETPERILDPGFVLHQGNVSEMEARVWGASVAKRDAVARGE